MKLNKGTNYIQEINQIIPKEFGKEYSKTNIKYYRYFYNNFPNLLGYSVTDQLKETTIGRLTWTYIRQILRVTSKEAKEWYLQKEGEQNRLVRTLEREISTIYYLRLISSQIKVAVEQEMKINVIENKNYKFKIINNSSVLGFLKIPNNIANAERYFEKALIDNLQKFILELGKGYAFVERQQLICTDITDLYIDFVFYNNILTCFEIIELKTTKQTLQDLGQLYKYLRVYNDLKKQETDNTTIGILQCMETDKAIAKYSVLNQHQQLLATKYMDYLPTEAELVAEIEREKLLLKN